MIDLGTVGSRENSNSVVELDIEIVIGPCSTGILPRKLIDLIEE